MAIWTYVYVNLYKCATEFYTHETKKTHSSNSIEQILAQARTIIKHKTLADEPVTAPAQMEKHATQRIA